MNKEVPEPEYIFPCMRGFWRAGCRGVQVAAPSQQKYTFESNVSLQKVKYPSLTVENVSLN